MDTESGDEQNTQGGLQKGRDKEQKKKKSQAGQGMRGSFIEHAEDEEGRREYVKQWGEQFA